MLINNLNYGKPDDLAEYGDLIIDGDDVFAIVQISPCVYRPVCIKSFNRKNDEAINFYRMQISEVLKNFNPYAVYIKRGAYNIIISNSISS